MTQASIPCVVPGCHRSIGSMTFAKRFGAIAAAEWICSRHWSTIPPIKRKVYARVRRRERRFGFNLPASARLWSYLVRQATAEGDAK